MTATRLGSKFGEKTKLGLHKNVMCCFEQILEAIPYDTTAVWPLTFYLKNYPSKMNKTCRTLLEK